MERPTPILFLDTSSIPTKGGAQKSLLFILRSLDRDRFAPHVFQYVSHDMEEKLQQYDIPYRNHHPEMAGIVHVENTPVRLQENYIPPVYRLQSLQGTWRDLGFRVKQIFKEEIARYRAIRAYAQEIGAQLIYLNGNFTNGLGAIMAARTLRIPCIAHQRILVPYTLLDRWYSRFVDLMIFYSMKYQDILLEAGIFPRYRTVIYNSVHPEDVPKRPVHEVDTQYRNEFRIPENVPLLGHVGTVYPIKSQHIILQGILRAWNPEHPFYVLMIGEIRDRQYYAYLQRTIEHTPLEPYVIFTGYRSDSLDLLNICRVSLEATQAEAGFSRVVMESLLLGKILTAPQEGCAEIITEGYNGFLYEDNSPDSLAEAIQRALAADPDTIGRNARETATALFDPHTVRTNIHAAIDGALHDFPSTKENVIEAGLKVYDSHGRERSK